MLTQERVRELFDYDPVSGNLTSKVYRGRLKKGDRAGHTSKRGYRRVGVDGKSYREHRVIWLWIYGSMPKDQIDHINGIRDDNRASNLREVNNSENHRNKKIPTKNKSGVIGVCWVKDAEKWKSYISLDRQIILGFYDEKIDAIEARKNAEIKYGYHQNHGKR